MRFDLYSNNYANAVTPLAPSRFFLSEDVAGSAQSFTVPANTTYVIRYGSVKYTSSAVVGDRQLRLEILDPFGVSRGFISAGAVQPASTTRWYLFMQGIYRETSFTDGMIQVPIPMDYAIPQLVTYKFWDSAEIDTTGDKMQTTHGVFEYPGIAGTVEAV